MKIYISGRISGLEINEARNNFARGECLALVYFRQQTRAVKCTSKEGYCSCCFAQGNDAGIEIINPMTAVKFSANASTTYADYMRADIKLMMDCAGIFMLNNWKQSKGARFEHKIAKWLNMAIGYEND